MISSIFPTGEVVCLACVVWLTMRSFTCPGVGVPIYARPPSVAWPQKNSGLRSSPTAAETISDREEDGLVGPVRRGARRTAKIVLKSGRPIEQPRELLEVTTYDRRGSRVENAYYLVSQISTADKEEYGTTNRVTSQGGLCVTRVGGFEPRGIRL